MLPLRGVQGEHADAMKRVPAEGYALSWPCGSRNDRWESEEEATWPGGSGKRVDVKVRISQIPEGGLSLEEDIPSDFFSVLKAEIPLTGACRVSLRLEQLHNSVLARGSVSGTYELECSRCLEKYKEPVAAYISVLFLGEKEQIIEGSEEAFDDDIHRSLIRNEQIDLSDEIRELLLLNTPLKPLCGEGCKGLCPSCGANLNLATCNCAPASVDPRFQKLGELKFKD